MSVVPYDYYADTPIDAASLACIADLVTKARAEATNSILVDNGDFLQGNPMGDFIAFEAAPGTYQTHPMISAMNTLGYDAGTLGNHEFNYGLPFLKNALKSASFPIVSANIVDLENEQPILPPYAIIERELTDGAGEMHPIKIGVIGFVPPQIMQWDGLHLAGKIDTHDILEAAHRCVPELRNLGADIVVAMCHTGFGSQKTTEHLENAAIPLAEVYGIDAMVIGHQHHTFPSPTAPSNDIVDGQKGFIHGTPAVMPGSMGSHLGVIDLHLERHNGTWRIRQKAAELRAVADFERKNDADTASEQTPDLVETTRKAHEATLNYVRRAVGKTSKPLHSYFAMISNDPTLQIVATAQREYAEQKLIGTEHEGLPILSAVAPFKAGGRGGPTHYTHIPAGDIAIKNVASLYPYPNTVHALKINGAQIKGWLERSATVFNQIEVRREGQALLNSAVPNYTFDVIDGLKYTIDLTQPARFDHDGVLFRPEAHRILNVTHNGMAIADHDSFVIVTNSYRAGGGGKFPGTQNGATVFSAHDTVRDVVIRHITNSESISVECNNTWRFAPLGGTDLLFDTSPNARMFVDQFSEAALRDTGKTRNGFAQLIITL